MSLFPVCNEIQCSQHQNPNYPEQHHHIFLGPESEDERIHNGSADQCDLSASCIRFSEASAKPRPDEATALEAEMREIARRFDGAQALVSLANGGRPGRSWLITQIRYAIHTSDVRKDREDLTKLLDWVKSLPDSWWDPNFTEKLNAELDDLAKELTEIAGWWVETSKADAERTIPKAIEYGSADFDTMAQAMLALVGDKFGGADDAEKMRVGREMAVLFYLNGKIGRALGAYAKGVMPSDDTLFDIRVYAMMWWRIRSTGTWVN